MTPRGRTLLVTNFVAQKPSGQAPAAANPERAVRHQDEQRIRAQIAADTIALRRIYGNTAVEVGRSTMIGLDKGRAVPRDKRFTRVWVMKQGRWQLVANHYSPLAAP